MIDEAHERSMNTDLAIGLLRKIISIRSDLRVIISSATLDAELFRDFFELNETNDPSKDTATIISVEGRAYPVSTFYTKTYDIFLPRHHPIFPTNLKKTL